MNTRKDTGDAVKSILALEVGGSMDFPLSMINTLRSWRYTNVRMLEARAEGKEFSVVPDLARRCVAMKRIK